MHQSNHLIFPKQSPKLTIAAINKLYKKKKKKTRIFNLEENFQKKKTRNVLEGIGRSDNCNAPFKYIVLVYQTGREPIHWILAKICNTYYSPKKKKSNQIIKITSHMKSSQPYPKSTKNRNFDKITFELFLKKETSLGGGHGRGRKIRKVV